SPLSGLPAAAVLSARVDQVIFFEDRAEVRRRLRCRVPAGSSLARVEGVTLVVDDSSLVATVRTGAGRVVAASVRRVATTSPASRAAEVDARETEHTAARRRLFDAHRALDRVEAEQDRASALLQAWEESLRRAPRGRPEALAPLRASHDELSRAHTATFDRLEQARSELEAATEAEQQAARRLAQVRATAPRHEAHVEVQLTAEAPTEVELEVTYRTPCALWRPEHHAQLTLPTATAPARLLLRTFAVVWQSTGETWADVRCLFSTARPSQAAGPPELTDDHLGAHRKPEPRTVIVEEREQTVQLAGLGRGARRADEMPGVDDGGEPLGFEGKAAATIPSDGLPVPVELGEVGLACEVDLVAFPEKSEAAYLRATATWTGKTPLLAGPVRVAVGPALLGLGATRFVAPGEPFELGFGHDDDLRVRRTLEEKRETAMVTGTQKISRRVKLFLSNHGRQPRALRVIERVPVSEIRDVVVEVTEPGGARLDPRDGLARFELTLAPGQQTELSLAYRLEASSRVEM
ncbi:MAG: mucoidy inhibitor MuiA family protein, partial [Myxococcales bacterium]